MNPCVPFIRIEPRSDLINSTSVRIPPLQDALHEAFHPCAATTRLLHYIPVRSDVEAGIMGCGSHTDWGCLTLLLSVRI